jgi:hypothetical protein
MLGGPRPASAVLRTLTLAHHPRSAGNAQTSGAATGRQTLKPSSICEGCLAAHLKMPRQPSLGPRHRAIRPRRQAPHGDYPHKRLVVSA